MPPWAAAHIVSETANASPLHNVNYYCISHNTNTQKHKQTVAVVTINCTNVGEKTLVAVNTFARRCASLPETQFICIIANSVCLIEVPARAW